MIIFFSAIEPTQYVVVWPISCKVKDISYIATIAIPSNLQIAGIFQEKAQFCYLLSISGVDTIGRVEIYEKYMTFSGKN